MLKSNSRSAPPCTSDVCVGEEGWNGHFCAAEQRKAANWFDYLDGVTEKSALKCLLTRSGRRAGRRASAERASASRSDSLYECAIILPHVEVGADLKELLRPQPLCYRFPRLILFAASPSEPRTLSSRWRKCSRSALKTLLNIRVSFHLSTPWCAWGKARGEGYWVECERGRNLILQAVPSPFFEMSG